jgi:hypothetical protein
MTPSAPEGGALQDAIAGDVVLPGSIHAPSEKVDFSEVRLWSYRHESLLPTEERRASARACGSPPGPAAGSHAAPSTPPRPGRRTPRRAPRTPGSSTRSAPANLPCVSHHDPGHPEGPQDPQNRRRDGQEASHRVVSSTSNGTTKRLSRPLPDTKTEERTIRAATDPNAPSRGTRRRW